MGVLSSHYLGRTLVTRPKYPPYRETSVAIALSHRVSGGVGRRLSLLHPHFFPLKWPIAVQRQTLQGGHRRKNLPLKPIVGAGVLYKFGADFFSGLHLPENGMFKPVFCTDFLCADFWCADFCADFCTHFYADFGCADFWCADFLRRFLCRFSVHRLLHRFSRRFSADFSLFRRLKNKCSRVTQKWAENLRKNNGPPRGGTPFHLCILEQTARHAIDARPTYPRRALSVHRGIFGPKGMLGFAPRFFKNKNQQKICSAKH